MSASLTDIEYLKSCLKSYPDFPKPGILFYDVFSLLSQPKAFNLLVDLLVSRAKSYDPPVTAIVALDSRGFLFGPIIALKLNIPFVPIRKKNKLPGKVLKATYQLEYGEDTLEIQQDALEKGQAVLLVDDLIATGGTLEAGCNLVKQLGCTVSSCLVVMELNGLKGRDNVSAPVDSLIQY
ncbi:adenine phosphoribosyltransferase [Neocloeon triangulifer]|uniref:adenine phosphoribosyltransferase n=1 Tax=Neocloeon triangulifer TaxID=2078957 RepID=UPI00286EC167|nr:adenine phosphoribosyltransferase [Neocloeon triangulifer]